VLSDDADELLDNKPDVPNGYAGFREILVKTDIDGDDILDDGDNSGSIIDNPCSAGNTLGCDDNCPNDSNPDQADSDGDGIGDACEEPSLPAPTGVFAFHMYGYPCDLGEINIYWNTPPDIHGCRVYWGTSAGIDENSNFLDAAPSMATIYSLSEDTTYFFRVSVGQYYSEPIFESPLSEEVSVYVPIYEVDMPYIDEAGYDETNDWIYIYWMDYSTCLSGVHVYWDTEPGVDDSSNMFFLSQIQTVHEGVQSGICYYYRLAGYDSYRDRESLLSEEFSVCVP